MSAATLNARAVYEKIRDLSGEIERLHGAQCVLVNQNRELNERVGRLEDSQTQLLARIDVLLSANHQLSHENDALFKALGMRALKAMTAPVRVDQALVARLIAALEPSNVFHDADLQRFRRECESQPPHRNSGN